MQCFLLQSKKQIEERRKQTNKIFEKFKFEGKKRQKLNYFKKLSIISLIFPFFNKQFNIS